MPNPLPVGTQVVKAPLLEISATHIRHNLANHKSIRYLVPDKVLEEIDQEQVLSISRSDFSQYIDNQSSCGN